MKEEYRFEHRAIVKTRKILVYGDSKGLLKIMYHRCNNQEVV